MVSGKFEDSTKDRDLESLLQEAIEATRRGDSGRLRELIESYPEHAQGLRDKLQWLRSLGLLSDPEQPITHFGRFRVRKCLGRGGMGVVYLAQDPSIGREVALKALGPHALLMAEARRRFERETRAIGRLVHPHIIRIFDVGEHQGVPYFTMEYIEGNSLDRVLEPRRLDGIQLLIAVAKAAHHAHEHGIVHRDIKPSNILLARDGRILLCDFGLALQQDELSLTQTGDILGTPAYLPPEILSQTVENTAFHPAGDIYSLGVTLYEVLTGRRPFQGKTLEETYAAIERGDPPPPRSYVSSLSRDLEAVCFKALEKDLSLRYTSARDFADDLQRVMWGESTLARPFTPVQLLLRSCRRHAIALSVVAVVLAVLSTALVTVLGMLERERAAHDLAEQRLAEIELFEEAVELRQLKSRAAQLFPIEPTMINDYRAWLAELEEKLARRSVQQDLRQSLLTQLQTDGSSRDLEWRLQESAELLALYSDLEVEKSEVVQRLTTAEWMQELMDLDLEEEWDWCLIDLMDQDDDPEIFDPLPGLAPLGRHPVSGLWEFWHFPSGEKPVWDEDRSTWKIGPQSGAVFVLLPGAEFLVGAERPSEERPQGSPHVDPLCDPIRESPIREAHVQPFLISKYELTFGQWRRLFHHDPWPGVQADEPVHQINWLECQELLPRFRMALPSQAQWQYACRAGSTTPWFTGSEPKSLQGYANLADRSRLHYGEGPVEEWLDDGYPRPAPVGRYRANAFGLHDPTGNVFELLMEFTQPGLLFDALRERNSAPASGGSFRTLVAYCRVTYERPFHFDARDYQLGVRPIYQHRRF